MKQNEKGDKTRDLKGEKALVTLNRRLNMLMMFDRKNKRSRRGKSPKN